MQLAMCQTFASACASVQLGSYTQLLGLLHMMARASIPHLFSSIVHTRHHHTRRILLAIILAAGILIDIVLIASCLVWQTTFVSVTERCYPR